MHYDSKRVHQGPGSWLYPGMPSADLWGKVDGGSSPAGRVDTELGLTQQIPGVLWDDPGAGDSDSGYIHCIHIIFFTQTSHRMFVDTLIKKN